jgi:hypothetical protein
MPSEEKGAKVMKDTKFGGRPAIRKPKPGRRVHLSLAVPQELKGKIEKAAHDRGWSISVEASHRLERSFESEALLPQLLELKYGSKLAGLLLGLGHAMQWAGHICLRAIAAQEDSDDWLDVPAAYDQAVLAASRVLEAGRLEVEAPKNEAPLQFLSVAPIMPIGVVAANRVFSSIQGRGASQSEIVEGAQIRELLGSSASRFKGEKK